MRLRAKSKWFAEQNWRDAFPTSHQYMGGKQELAHVCFAKSSWATSVARAVERQGTMSPSPRGRVALLGFAYSTGSGSGGPSSQALHYLSPTLCQCLGPTPRYQPGRNWKNSAIFIAKNRSSRLGC